MYRTPTHESRYKQGTRDRESKGRAGRYEEPRESSEGSSSEEDEESTDRCTEDSEDTTESQFGGRRREECSAESSVLERERPFNRYSRPEDILMRAYYADEKLKKQDKVTQKNFLSPFPSFLIPPIYRDAPGRPNYRYTSSDAVRENQEYMLNYGRPTRGSPRSAYDEGRTRCTHRCRKEKKQCEQPREKRETKHHSSKGYKPERILTCLQGESSLDPSSTFSKNPHSHESTVTAAVETRRRQKSPPQDNKTNELLNCRQSKDYLPSKDNQTKTRSSAQGRSTPAAETVREIIRTKQNEEERPEKTIGPGQVREKLVYVVEEEEEGKKVTKLETDLFSVNEILTIKKDLMELSEFAKKLKKLKEMKKDAEKGKPSSKTSCQCKPVAELLKDVNKRIEALEARQEELEKGSLKTGQKTVTDLESNKTTDPRASSNSPPTSPVVREQSALTTALSLPKTEMNLSKVGFSNNSEIANELMDIKNQLQKLEKRRMSETTPEAGPLGKSKPANKRDLGIAVFSSKTYILTSENYKKKMDSARIKDQEKSKECFSGIENPKSKNEQIKENVSNWLKNMSPVQERSESDIAKFLEEEALGGEKDSHVATCANSTLTPIFRDSGFENKEPPKNRASPVKTTNNEGPSLEVLMKNEKMSKVGKEQVSRLSYKECVLTTSGRLFFLKSDEAFPGGSPIEEKVASKPEASSQLKGLPKKIRRSVSSGSIPSAILAKEHVGRMKARAQKESVQGSPKPIKSPFDSVQELSASSSGLKDQKGVRNMNVKNILSALSKDKIHKESKNNIVKRLEGNMNNFKRCEEVKSSSSFSQLLGTVDLDAGTAEKTSDSLERHDKVDYDMQVYSVGPITKFNFRSLEDRGPPRCIWKDTVKRRKAVVEPASQVWKKIQNQEPECIKNNEPSTSHQPKCEELRPPKRREYEEPRPPKRRECEEPRPPKKRECEEPRPPKNRECDCDHCCTRRLKKYSSEGRLSDLETASSAMSNASVEDPESKRCRRIKEKRERIQELQKEKKCREQELKERKNERLKRIECKKIERRRRSREQANEKRNRQRARRKRSKERNRRRSREDCLRVGSREKLRKKRSKEQCKPKKKSSKQSIFKSGSRFFHKCQSPRRSPCCHPECRLSRSSSRITEDPPCEIEKPPAVEKPPICSEPNSKEYAEIYAKLQKQKQQVEREKLDDSCMFGSFFKSLRRLYPKFSHLQFGNFSGELAERKLSQQQAKKTVECLENEVEECASDDDEDSADSCDKHVHSNHSLKNRLQQYHHHRHDQTLSSQSVHPHNQNYNESREHLKTCKCIRVYLQTQKCQPWPGIAPCQDSDKRSDRKTDEQTDEKTDDVICTESPESSKTYNRSDFIFPGVLPEIQCVGHSREERCKKRCETICKRKCKKCNKKTKKAKHKKKDKCCKPPKHHRRRNITGRLCACVRCGNVHEKIVNRNPVQRPGQDSGVCKPLEQSPPMFSFLRYFCKYKPSKKSVFKRLSEVRYLKTCSGKKSNRQCVECKHPRHSATRLRSAEHRARHARARKNHEDECCCCCCEGKQKKKKKKKKKKGSECSTSDKSEKPKKKKKKKKKKKYCDCPENPTHPQKPSQIEFCACPALYNITKKAENKETSEANDNNSTNDSNEISCTNESSESGTKTTTTTTASETTADETKLLTISKLENELRKKDSRLKEKLSSIQCLLKNIQKLKRAKCQAKTNPDPTEECIKCCQKMGQDLKNESSSFLQRLKCFKGNTNEKKKKAEKNT